MIILTLSIYGAVPETIAFFCQSDPKTAVYLSMLDDPVSYTVYGVAKMGYGVKPLSKSGNRGFKIKGKNNRKNGDFLRMYIRKEE